MFSFALPAKLTTYRLYQPNSTNVRTTFELSDYHRVVRAIHLPVLVDLVHQNLPEGVELSLRQVSSCLYEGLHKSLLSIE
ncbi:hypothetical protein CLF_103794 [Clonorchis sinensis]|uniref:Uncharacterized protein n=1 Tax=Clonorchis sinensis TaxID=79923 RepID=G7YAE6_CLOSI|nr:hypothetical protein CLF_103794 [Clonorchis sinensis]